MFPNLAPRPTFVLPLTRETDISHARALINGNTSIASTVLAVVSAGTNCINRDYSTPTLREWSWHVVDFHKFADAITEAIQITPDQLESRDWSRPYPQYAGFHDMTVVRELGQKPLEMRIQMSGETISVFWSCPGIDWVYILETAMLPISNDSPQQWFPIQGAAWPQATNSWQIRLNPTIQLLRVKATPVDLDPK